MKELNVVLFDRAAKVFPYDRTIAIGPGGFVAIYGTINDDNRKRVTQSLASDPWATDLLRASFRLNYELGHQTEATADIKRLHEMVPNNPVFQELTKRMTQ